MNRVRLSVCLLGAWMLGGCSSLAPEYHVPHVAVAAEYFEHSGWQEGTPQDATNRGSWWTVLGDPQLDGLENRLTHNNPDLQVLLARHTALQNQLVELRSGLFPNVFGLGAIDRNRQSAHRPLRGVNQPSIYSSSLLGAGVSYDTDLWGRIRDEVRAGTYGVQADAAAVASAQLSLEADLAATYMALRGLDWTEKVYNEDIHQFEISYQITLARFKGGVASGLDLNRAKAQLSSVEALRDHLVGKRVVLEHSIAVLVGEDPNEFHLAYSPEPIVLPSIPIGVPGQLLQRRPDVAQAERLLAAANARIGVAKAAYFPDLTLNADLGYESMGPARWLSAPNLFWSLGPQFLVTLFDAHALDAQVAAARDRYIQQTASYRSVVLKAFQEVDDQLGLLNSEQQEAQDSGDATQAAQKTAQLANIQYKEGAVNYLEVAIAQASELEAERYDVALQTRRAIDTVGLIRALGGGWDRSRLPSVDSLDRQKVAQIPAHP